MKLEILGQLTLCKCSLYMLTFLLLSCQTGTTSKLESAHDNDSVETHDKTDFFKQIFHNIPSPIEMAKFIQISSTQYNPLLPNQSGLESRFLTQDCQAVNMGVYGADLSYCRAFDQIQESIKYLSSIRNLIEALQIPKEKTIKSFERIESNLTYKDSIINIVTELFTHTDAYLKENNREGTSVLILIGCWIEGIYITLNLATEDSNKKMIYEKIAEQKHSAESLVHILKPYAQVGGFRQKIFDYLLNVNQAFTNVDIEHKTLAVKNDTDNKKTYIIAENKYTITPETFAEIKEKIFTLRSFIIKN